MYLAQTQSVASSNQYQQHHVNRRSRKGNLNRLHDHKLGLRQWLQSVGTCLQPPMPLGGTFEAETNFRCPFLRVVAWDLEDFLLSPKPKQTHSSMLRYYWADRRIKASTVHSRMFFFIYRCTCRANIARTEWSLDPRRLSGWKTSAKWLLQAT